ALTYSNSDDTLWLAPQASERAYQFSMTGSYLGHFDTNDSPNALAPGCNGINRINGLSARSDAIYVTGRCTSYFRYSTSGTLLGSVSMSGASEPADIACDDTTFGLPVNWLRDNGGNRIIAIQVEAGSCLAGVPGPLKRATGLYATPAIASVDVYPAIPPRSSHAVYFPNFSAVLYDAATGQAIAGKIIDFFADGLPGLGIGRRWLCSAVTNSGGRATCGGVEPEVYTIVGLGYQAVFAGDAGYQMSLARGTLILALGRALPY
ncbi:MAG TPA: hypothetical protein VM841_04560, partial [Actinomycetota bacterium]|nr:hypothetical protein [Actinomycetota bacterium]